MRIARVFHSVRSAFVNFSHYVYDQLFTACSEKITGRQTGHIIHQKFLRELLQECYGYRGHSREAEAC